MTPAIDISKTFYRKREKMKKQFFLLLIRAMVITAMIFLVNALSVYSADITGTWKAEFDTQIGVQKYTFTFQKTGDQLTGVADSDIGGEKNKVTLTDVKQDGDKISFVEMMTFQGMELRISYEGTVTDGELKMTRHVGDVATEELVAKRDAAVKPPEAATEQK
jgi:hypothetical protein